MKTEKKFPLGIYVAILFYGLLPRVTVNMPFFKYFSLSRTLIVMLVTIAMLVIAYQKREKGKWETANLWNMVLLAYIVCILFTIFQFIPTVFL
ncbi:hypothetical protein [Enterococcus massiliensis]|uniref:hypothetical protein n=1 Tax=Enterococcus massiliensis TaxID=1640685 RepID=UPI00065E5378|nr:hypothetical protein [Enterococcus massiliensis]